MDISPASREQIAVEAADWFVRLQEAPVTAAQHEAFGEWLLRSPVHIQEYLEISQSWVQLSPPDVPEFTEEALLQAIEEGAESRNVVQLIRGHSIGDQSVPSELYAVSSRQSLWVGFAGSVLLILGGVLGYAYLQRASDFTTAVGEQRSVTLSDGSIVFLNTNSAVRLRWTSNERRIELLRGEARFKAAKDVARPFIVAANAAKVKALGTVFNVRADGAETDVAVLEGRIELSAAPASVRARSTVELATGERAQVSGQGIRPNSGPSIDRVEAWLGRQLIFQDESLGQVVAEFNRYRAEPLILDDPRLAALKINGKFDAGDPEPMIAQLATTAGVFVNRPLDGSIHLMTGLSRSTVEK